MLSPRPARRGDRLRRDRLWERRSDRVEVNGHEFSEASIDEELQALADNARLAERASISEGTIDAGLTAAWLTTLVEDEVVSGALARSRYRGDPRRPGRGTGRGGCVLR